MFEAALLAVVASFNARVDISFIILSSSNAGALADKLAVGISPVNLVPSNFPAVVILFAKFLVILPILSYFGKTLIVISAEAAGAVTKVKVVPETV